MAIAPLIAAGIAAAPALFGKKRKAQAPDISRLLGSIKSGADRQRQIAAGLEPKLQKRLDTFRTGSREVFGQFKEGASRQIDVGRESLSELRNVQGSELARTLQERSFRPVRGATEFVRQNLATVKSGAANEALAAPTIEAQRQFGTALNDLTSQILQGDIDLADQANRQKLSLIETELGFEKDILSTIFKTGTQADKDLISEFLSIQRQQTANELQAIQFAESGRLAADSANARASAEREAALFGVGGNLAGTLFGNIGRGSSPNEGVLSTQVEPQTDGSGRFGFPGNRLSVNRPPFAGGSVPFPPFR